MTVLNIYFQTLLKSGKCEVALDFFGHKSKLKDKIKNN